jgi:hypothetical protein
MQTKQILEKIVKRFRPFVVTASDGYSVSIESLNHLLVGKDSIVIMDSEGLFEFYPDRASHTHLYQRRRCASRGVLAQE